MTEAARTLADRKWIIELIQNDYDKAPDQYRMGDNWNDGTGRIADQIIERFRSPPAGTQDREADDQEVERIMGMSEAELRAECAADGLDWDTEIAKVTAIFERAKVEADMRLAIRAWIKCDPAKRPSASALGARIAQIADGLATALTLERKS